MPEEMDYEKNLVWRASRDPAAFQALYEHYFDRVYRYVAARVSNPQDTEDVVSDIFLLVMTRLKHFRNNNKHSFAAWIFTISRNAIVDFYRHRERLPVQVSIDEWVEQYSYDVGLDEQLIEREHAEVVRSLLQILPKRRREVVMLRYFAELRNLEIAQVLDIDERTVASHLSKGLKDLYEAYQEINIGRENEE